MNLVGFRTSLSLKFSLSQKMNLSSKTISWLFGSQKIKGNYFMAFRTQPGEER